MLGSSPRLKISVLVTCFNRAMVTRKALQSLQRQNIDADLRVYLVDDSTDEETREVSNEFDFVTYIKGTGGLYWNGGMYEAWRFAEESAFDYLLLFNDDVKLDADAIGRAVEAQHSRRRLGEEVIIVGATRNRSGEISYSGFLRKKQLFNFELTRLPLSGEAQYCDTFNGNFVLISSDVVGMLGRLDKRYFHSMGDIDYGLRATRRGIPCIVLAGSIGECEANDAKKNRGWGNKTLSVFERWKIVNTHLGLPIMSWFIFTRRFAGPFWPVVFIRQYLYLLGLDLLCRRRRA